MSSTLFEELQLHDRTAIQEIDTAMPDSARGVTPDEARNVIERISAKLGEPPDRIRAQFLRLDDDGSEYVDELRAERRKNNEKLIRL